MTDRRLLGRVARLYYEEALTHADIAALLGVSRVKITRLLAEARQEGVVEIVVHSDEPAFADLEQQLARRFGLLGAWISPPSPDQSLLGRAGARAIKTLLPLAHSVTLGQGTSVRDAVRSLSDVDLPQIEVYPFGGGRTGRASGEDSSDVASALARAIGGSVYGLHAPLISPDPASAELFTQASDLQLALHGAASSDLAIFGVGGLAHSERYLKKWIDHATFTELRSRGAIGDISGRFFNAQGQGIDSKLDQSVIGLSIAQLRTIPTRLVLAGGMDKVEVLAVAIGTGIANALATDSSVAEALLATQD